MDEKYKIHAFYVLLILVAIIIILVTRNFGSIPSLFEYIVFALAVSSIILAFLAIVYSFISNASLSKIIATILKASQDISESASDTQSATRDLEIKISKIPPILEKVHDKFQETSQMLKEQSKVDLPPSTEVSTLEGRSQFAEEFLQLSSIFGLMILYACSLSSKKNMPFKFEDFWKLIRQNNGDYHLGFLVASGCARLVDFKYANDIFTISSMNPKISSGVEEALRNKIARRKNENWKANWLEDIKKVESYFSET